MTEAELKGRLLEAGISPTNQRLAVARYVLGEAEHPTAAEVYERVSTELSVVSKATIYNTLGVLVREGLVHEVRGVSEGVVRYDGNSEPHHHLWDRRTGRVYDLPWDEIRVENMKELTERYHATRFTIVIDGEPETG